MMGANMQNGRQAESQAELPAGTPVALSAEIQRQILSRLSKGLAISEFPYQALANELGILESDLLAFIRHSVEQGLVKRIGCVVNHHKVGYRANAMVVWNIPDEQVDTIGERLAREPKVTLCYQRPRRLPEWPYNLFTMIHGKHREQVLKSLQEIVNENELGLYPRDVLFSTRKFKQTGARFHD